MKVTITLIKIGFGDGGTLGRHAGDGGTII